MTNSSMKISEIKEKLNNSILATIKDLFDVELKQIDLIYPPSITLGDFAIECFSLSKALKLPPAVLAQKLAEHITGDFISSANAAGPYINIKLKNELLFSAIAAEIVSEKYGDSSELNNEITMVEYLSPNTNKPLHLGHVRNGSLGMATALILESAGAKVVKANLVNDRGIHICKSMLAWQKWGNNETPESTGIKGDHLVGKYYVKYSIEAEKNPEIEKEAQEVLIKWEMGDPEVIALWEKMNSWVLSGFEQTFRDYRWDFDKTYYESNTYKLGKKIVEKGVVTGVFQKEENSSVTATLPADEFGKEKDGALKKATLIRKDGTSVYITQDLETTRLKFEENNLSRSIWVVGSEQDYHFKVLFKILEMLGFEWSQKCFHLSYGMVYLPEGKMKSREGKVVDADDLLSEMTELATQEIKKRDTENKIGAREVSMRAKTVADAAIKYYLLQFSPHQDIHFDPKASLSFEGNTGPYLQYTYARAIGILEKSESDAFLPDFNLLGNVEELTLANRLIDFPDQIIAAARDLNPAKVASSTYEIAKSFNTFYQKHHVLNAEDKGLREARISLVRSTAIAIKKGLHLLNIQVLEKM